MLVGRDQRQWIQNHCLSLFKPDAMLLEVSFVLSIIPSDKHGKDYYVTL
jgi:hypothetical protein